MHSHLPVGLWITKELSHQHSREIAQHHARTGGSSVLSGQAGLPNAATTEALSNRRTTAGYHRSTADTDSSNNNSADRAMRRRQQHQHQIFHQTVEDIGRYASVFYNAATDAWNEQIQKRHEHRSSYRYHDGSTAFASVTRASVESNSNINNNRATAYLHDFGIPVGDDDGHILQQQPHQGQEGLEHSLMIDYASLDEQHQHQSRRNNDRTLQQRQDDFVFLPSFRLRPPAEGWGVVSNLDLYFSSLYSYFYHRGLLRIVARGIVELIRLVFTMLLSVFLFLYVDWKALSSCIDEATCRSDFFAYVVHRPFSRMTIWNVMVVLYCLLFTSYTLFAVLAFLRTVQDALQAKWVFEERLGISARKLQGGAVDWDRDVVARLVELQRSGEYRISLAGQCELDALVVAQRIMRKENFLVALFNRGLLDLTAPIPCIGNNMFCSSLEVQASNVFAYTLFPCRPKYSSLNFLPLSSTQP
jgi:hypothetical protein